MEYRVLNERMKAQVWWNTWGTIFIESIHITHQICLFLVIEKATYGQLGLLFSAVFLAVNLSDFGFIPTLTRIMPHALRNRLAFFQLIIGGLMINTLIFFVAGMLVSFLLYRYAFFSAFSALRFWHLLIVATVTEGIRTSARMILHLNLWSAAATMIDGLSTVIYVTFVWTLLLTSAFGTVSAGDLANYLFILYVIISMAATIAMVIAMLVVWAQLPYKSAHTWPPQSLPKLTMRRLLYDRFVNYLLTASKNMYRGNFIVPLLAAHHPPAVLAVIKIASYIAESLRALVRSVIGFSGNALLVQLSGEPENLRQGAFSQIFGQVMRFFAPFTLFLVTFLVASAIGHAHHGLWGITFASIGFLTLSMLDHPIYAYEQLFMAESKTIYVLLFRALEVIGFFVISLVTIRPLPLIFSMVIIRLLVAALTALVARHLWRFNPPLIISKTQTILPMALGIIMAALISGVAIFTRT